MRANHATEPQEPAPRGVAGARRAFARWLPRPRTVAAGGALLAQLWGVGATGAYAATAAAEPSPGQPRSAVRQPLHDGAAPNGQSAARPPGPGRSAAAEPGRAPGPVTEPVDGAADAVDTLQERIRSGGLPLPGQGAAVPDAFALASGLLGTVPAQGRPGETRASREGEPSALPAVPRPRSGTTDPTGTARPDSAGTPPVQETAAHEGPDATRPTGPATATATDSAAAPAAPADSDTPEALALADTATVTAETDGSATATAVLAPIAAGLLLTGAAMCKHRGLPRGH
ncbi:hypothetical protein ACFWIQ_23785 [Kitasatospora sp. NPDC127059]|uniref:hypothetical protein n=1 Tax=unclassified Kitasatospora TaxID=2633591 RepID=UPI003646D4CE